MKLAEQHNIERQARIIEAAKVPLSVAVAMECWAEWMQHGEVGRGYPKKSLGFSSGGINCWDDMDDSAMHHMAISTDGAIKGLSEKERNCIYIIWLDMLICYATVDVDAIAADAVRIVYRGLVARGVA